MWKKLACCAIALSLTAMSALAAPKGGVTLTYYGQSCFLIQADGVSIVADPYKNLGYAPLKLAADVVTMSHEHFDHNAFEVVSGSPKLLHGVNKDAHAETLDVSVKGARFRTLPVFHDDSGGSKRGENAVFIIDAGGLRIVHIGDLGHALSPEQLKALGKVDVLLVPVGGLFTIDAKQASDLVRDLKPRVVVPMHYKTKSSAMLPIETEKQFMKYYDHIIEAGHTLKLSPASLPAGPAVYHMQYR